MSSTDVGSDTRAKVHAAALALFVEQGYDGTSLQQIADRLNVTKAAVYYYHRTKEDLLAALLQPVLADMELLVVAAESKQSSGRRTRRLLDDYVDLLIRHRGVVPLMTRDIGIRAHPLMAAGLAPLVGRLERLILGDPGDDDARLRLTVALSGLPGALIAFPDWSDERLRVALGDAGRALLPRRRTANPTG